MHSSILPWLLSMTFIWPWLWGGEVDVFCVLLVVLVNVKSSVITYQSCHALPFITVVFIVGSICADVTKFEWLRNFLLRQARPVSVMSDFCTVSFKRLCTSVICTTNTYLFREKTNVASSITPSLHSWRHNFLTSSFCVQITVIITRGRCDSSYRFFQSVPVPWFVQLRYLHPTDP